MNFKASKQDYDLAFQIADRAETLLKVDRQSTVMDIIATHANGNKLKLADLATADDFTFTHDVMGIQRHIDRKTGKLTDCFSPRLSA